MKYNTEQKLDEIVKRWGLMSTKKKMFGGIAYMLGDKMAFATMAKDSVIVRTRPEQYADLLKQDYATEAYMKDRLMKNWAVIDMSAVSGSQLEAALAIGRDYALDLAQDKS